MCERWIDRESVRLREREELVRERERKRDRERSITRRDMSGHAPDAVAVLGRVEVATGETAVA